MNARRDLVQIYQNVIDQKRQHHVGRELPLAGATVVDPEGLQGEAVHSLDHEMTFDSPSVRDRVFTLSFAAAFVEHAKAGDGPEEVKSDELESIKTVPRRRFEIGVAMLWLFLDHRIRQTEPASEPQTLAIGF